MNNLREAYNEGRNWRETVDSHYENVEQAICQKLIGKNFSDEELVKLMFPDLKKPKGILRRIAFNRGYNSSKR